MSWEHLPLILTALGGALAIAGAFWSNSNQIKSERALAAQARAYAEQLRTAVLGDDESFCQLTVYVGEIGWYVSTYHRGNTNVYDVQVLIREIAEDGAPLSGLTRNVIGTLTSNTWPWVIYPLGAGWPSEQSRPRYFTAQITQRNGTSVQAIVVRPRPDRRIEFGFLRLDFKLRPFPPDHSRLPRPLAVDVTVPADDINRLRERWQARDSHAWP